MKFCSLTSGSKGNCSLIISEQSKILVDCGINLNTLEKFLAEENISADKIDAIFVTHEHNDHIFGLDAFCKKYRPRVFVHKKGFLELAKKLYWTNHLLTPFEEDFRFKDLSVSTFVCSHDSSYCVGYRFDDGKNAVAQITDIGEVDDKIVDFCKNCRLVLLESNHDEFMLSNGDYPYLLKKRIAGRFGHLSNEKAAQTAVKFCSCGVRRLLLGHLSQNNNTPETAFFTACNELEKNGLQEGKDIKINVVKQFEKSEVFEVE